MELATSRLPQDPNQERDFTRLEKRLQRTAKNEIQLRNKITKLQRRLKLKLDDRPSTKQQTATIAKQTEKIRKLERRISKQKNTILTFKRVTDGLKENLRSVRASEDTRNSISKTVSRE